MQSQFHAMFRLLLCIALLAGLAAAADYCSVCDDHTLCRYTSSSAGSACKNFKTSALTTTDQSAIVKAHNELRNKVALGQETRGIKKQPAAANMRKMVRRCRESFTSDTMTSQGPGRSRGYRGTNELANDNSHICQCLSSSACLPDLGTKL